VALRLQMAIPLQDRSGGAETLANVPAGIKLLTVIDTIIDMGGPAPQLHSFDTGRQLQRREAAQLLATLARFLEEGASVYYVDIPGKRLARRADATAATAFQEATTAAANKPDAGSAATQLKSAWDTIHALHPDAPKAYREAVSAVESAAHAIIEPNHPTAHMGTMLGHLRANTGKYTLAIPGPSGTGDIAPLLAMMELLWTGQTSRHGNKNPARLETQQEAQMAVHLAVALVNWFTSGAIRRAR
jgi:hypothetical protein